MKHISAIIGLCALAFGASAAETMECDLGYLTPAQGAIDLEEYQAGISSVNFALPADWSLNRNCKEFITLSRDGELVAQVVAYNYKQVHFDSLLTFTWNIGFFGASSPEALLPGNYEVYLPEGLFTYGEDRVPNSPITLHYSIGGARFVFAPQPGVYEEIFRFTMSFPNAESIALPQGNDVFTIFNMYGAASDDDEATSIKLRATLNQKTKQIVFMTPNPLSQAGTWFVDIPEGSVEVTLADGTVVPAGESWGCTYVIPNQPYGAPEVEPAGPMGVMPGTFTLHYPGFDVNAVNSMSVVNLCNVNPDGTTGSAIVRYIVSKSKEYGDAIVLKNWNGGNKEMYLAPGTYRMSSNQPLFNVKDNNTFCNYLNFDIEIVAPTDAPYVVTPATGSTLESLNEISAAFAEGTQVEILNSDICWLTGEKVRFPYYAKMGETPNSVTFTTVYPVEEAGDYTFASASGAMAANGVNYVIAADFTIFKDPNAIAERFADKDGLVDVYTTDGRTMMRRASAEQLRSLAKGVYVVGGRVVILK